MQRFDVRRGMRRPWQRPVGALLASMWLLAGTAQASDDWEFEEAVLSVHHGSVVSTLANPASDGHQLGDLRVVSLPITDAAGHELGRLDATLTTVSIDVPALNDETRISTLVFAFGDGVDQLVVNGTGFYPAAGGTIDLNSVLVRPVTGGSGIFAGATGSAETRHFADDTWEHTFFILIPERDDDEDEDEDED